jgi:hypothetical protein
MLYIPDAGKIQVRQNRRAELAGRICTRPGRVAAGVGRFSRNSKTEAVPAKTRFAGTAGRKKGKSAPLSQGGQFQIQRAFFLQAPLSGDDSASCRPAPKVRATCTQERPGKSFTWFFQSSAGSIKADGNRVDCSPLPGEVSSPDGISDEIRGVLSLGHGTIVGVNPNRSFAAIPVSRQVPEETGVLRTWHAPCSGARQNCVRWISSLATKILSCLRFDKRFVVNLS